MSARTHRIMLDIKTHLPHRAIIGRLLCIFAMRQPDALQIEVKRRSPSARKAKQ